MLNSENSLICKNACCRRQRAFICTPTEMAGSLFVNKTKLTLPVYNQLPPTTDVSPQENLVSPGKNIYIMSPR